MERNTNNPLIFAHRGFHAEIPENTLAAFARAAELGFAGIETDVQLDSSGTAILYHDHVLRDGRPVRTLTRKELSAFVGYDVPLLADALDLGRDMIWDIEIKDIAAVGPAAKILRDFSHTRDLFVSSFVHAAVRELVESLGLRGALLVSHCPEGALLDPANLAPGIDTIVWNCNTVDLKSLEWAISVGLRNMVYAYLPGPEHAKFFTPDVEVIITDYQATLQSK